MIKKAPYKDAQKSTDGDGLSDCHLLVLYTSGRRLIVSKTRFTRVSFPVSFYSVRLFCRKNPSALAFAAFLSRLPFLNLLIILNSLTVSRLSWHSCLISFFLLPFSVYYFLFFFPFDSNHSVLFDY